MSVRLSDILRKQIQEEMRVGQRFPTEHALAAEHAVSRATVRETLKLLEQEGLLNVRPGRGRFVALAPTTLVSRPITALESLSEMLAGMGIDATCRVLSAEIGSPTEAEAAALDLAPGATVVRMVRVYEAERPLVISINTFESGLLEGASLSGAHFDGSLDLWLAARGHKLKASVAQIRAEPLPPGLGGVSDDEAQSPWISITERCVDAAGSAVAFARDFHRGDLFTFTVLRRRE